jgi:hypothetical protein
MFTAVHPRVHESNEASVVEKSLTKIYKATLNPFICRTDQQTYFLVADKNLLKRNAFEPLGQILAYGMFLAF